MKKRNKLRSGSLLIEVSVALGLLIALGTILLHYIFTILQASNWISTQALSEAALSYEVAFMEKIPIEETLSSNSPFPNRPNHALTTTTIGTLRNGVPVEGQVRRLRIPILSDSSEFQLERWRLFTSLEYTINDVQYFKTRSVVRTR